MKKNELQELEAKSIFIIREAYRVFKNKIAILASFGKDSTTLLYLVRKAFLGHVPMPVIHLDAQTEFEEVYEFRDWLAREWNLKLIVEKYGKGIDESEETKKVCHCTLFKTQALKRVVAKYGFKALMVAIRRDEHGIRAKERYFSPRKNFTWDYLRQPPELWEQFNVSLSLSKEMHIRVHPMLHWREIDVWKYIKQEKIPIVNLYFSGTVKKGYRYRSLGCKNCTVPIPSQAKNLDEIIEELKTTEIGERAGRLKGKEKEYVMQKLRALGYM